jgi:hypothetical protein
MVSEYPANLYVPGFPKCFTTSFVAALSDIGSVYVPEIKEPGFFIKDDPNTSVKDFDRYCKLFSNTSREWLVDGTVSYIYTPQLLNNIKKVKQDAKFIFLMRNPNRAAMSMYHFNNRLNGEVSYETALIDEPYRLRGERLPKVASSSGMPWISVCYKRGFDYAHWLNQLDESVLNDSLIITSELLIGDPESASKYVCDFLSYSSKEFILHMPKDNGKLDPIDSWLTTQIAYPPEPIATFKRFLKSRFDLSDTKIMNSLYGGLRGLSQKGNNSNSKRPNALEIFDIDQVKRNLDDICSVAGLEEW